MEILIKRFVCDFCGSKTEVELGICGNDLKPDEIQFKTVVYTDEGSFCDPVCHGLYLCEKYGEDMGPICLREAREKGISVLEYCEMWESHRVGPVTDWDSLHREITEWGSK